MSKKYRFVALLIFIISSNIYAREPADTIKATLNGLEFVFDASSGSILRMSYPATGAIIEASPDSAGLLDLAFPVEEFEAMRLASRFSKNVQITRGEGTVTIHWDSLGASRSFDWYKGKVSATVTLKEESDGQSVSLSCKVDNRSDHAIPQVLFPDFFGIVPFCGKQGTEFRTGGTAIKPFVDLVAREHDNFYAVNESTRWFHYGFVLNGENLVIKWMDIGGLKGGLSLFAKTWGSNKAYDDGVFLQLSEISGKLRYMKTLFTTIVPGASWQSDEYIITPHANGWAKGIIPYRNWAKQNIKKLYPMPDHVRDGLGYWSIWMKASYYPKDSLGINFRFSDLPKVAREAKEHDLGEIVLWNWFPGLQVQLEGPDKYLGTEQDMAKAIIECKKIGVNVAPFINMFRVRSELAYKYGVRPNNESYTYGPEFLPRFLPRYTKEGMGPTIPQSNPAWQKDAFASVKHLIDIGITSLSWDQFFSNTAGPENYLDTLMTKVNKIVKEKDPQASTSGEAGTNIEFETKFLDYTWNWDYNDGADYRALINCLPSPRINVNIDQSVAEAKYGFADNLYLNITTRKPDGINGSDYISNHPDMSAALKQCARLRKQFLNYFVNGTFIADCILSKESTDAHVSAYVLPKSILVIVINKGDKKPITFESDIEPWLKSATGRYKIKHYTDGKLMKTTNLSGARWIQKTPNMNNLDICLYEVIAE